MNHSESIATIAPAFVAAQAKIGVAIKDKPNPGFKGSKYADLGAVMDACMEALHAQGIAVLQTPAPSEPGKLALDTVLLHTSGEWMSGQMTMPLGKTDPQGYGSAMTYARRYSLAAMVGVRAEDDDGEGAMGRGNNSQGRAPQKPTPPAPAPVNDDWIIDDDAFRSELDQVFHARQFKPSQADSALNSILAAYNVVGIDKLDADQRAAILNAIAMGKADKFKNSNGTPKAAPAAAK